MRSCFFLLVGTLFLTDGFSQAGLHYLSLIDSNNIKKHACILASDSLEGRDTGEAGQKKAADYIRSEYRKIGIDSLTTGYLQVFTLVNKQRAGTLSFDKTELHCSDDFSYKGFYDTLKIDRQLCKAYTLKQFLGEENISPKCAIVLTDKYESIDFESVQKKAVKNVFFVCSEYNAERFRRTETNGLSLVSGPGQQHLFLNGRKVKCVPGKRYWIGVEAFSKKVLTTENIIAFVPGSDSVLKNEFVVVSAHYDHIGIKDGKIYNGADDNASGTSALLELARVLKEAQKQGEQPKRSVLFICFTGEECGLLGSLYYSVFPLVPLKNTVADFNIDMIGRKDEAKEKDRFSVYVIGSDKISQDFHLKHEGLAQKHQKLTLDYTYNKDNHPDKMYYRSDHYNFAKNGIPSIFYFGGFHEDYHQFTDDIEKLNFTKIEVIAELVFDAIWEFGN